MKGNILKEMATLNVWLQIYGLKTTHNLLKLSNCNQIIYENTVNWAT